MSRSAKRPWRRRPNSHPAVPAQPRRNAAGLPCCCAYRPYRPYCPYRPLWSAEVNRAGPPSKKDRTPRAGKAHRRNNDRHVLPRSSRCARGTLRGVRCAAGVRHGAAGPLRLRHRKTRLRTLPHSLLPQIDAGGHARGDAPFGAPDDSRTPGHGHPPSPGFAAKTARYALMSQRKPLPVTISGPATMGWPFSGSTMRMEDTSRMSFFTSMPGIT